MALLVQKYGGTSVASVPLIENAARRVTEQRDRGNQVVIVLSAMGDATDRLADLAREVTEDPPARELDALLATGELVSTALFAMALESRGCRARSYQGGQAGILTDGAHTRARILGVECGRLSRDLGRGIVPVVAGFQGVTDEGEVTTIGRGGSDTTAVALAVALGADECQILTDVDGVYTADPRVVPSARRLNRLTFGEMLELAGQGSRVLQLRAVEFARKYRVPLRVLSSFGHGSGTLISQEEPDVEAPVVSGIAFNRDEAEITVSGVPDKPGTAYKILAPVAGAGIEVDMVVLNAPHGGRVDFSFTVHRNDFAAATELVSQAVAGWDNVGVHGDDRVAKVAVVGVGMRSHAGVASRLFAALAGEGINIRVVSTSEIKISVLLSEVDLEPAVRSLHEAFQLDQAVVDG